MARRHTPYFHQFVALGAEMVDRIGFDSALRFTSSENEHLATRNRAGLYDVYYQVLVDVKGADAEKLLQRALVNDVARMVDGKVMYSSLCNDAGGMIDDLTCFRLSSSTFLAVPHAIAGRSRRGLSDRACGAAPRRRHQSGRGPGVPLGARTAVPTDPGAACGRGYFKGRPRLLQLYAGPSPASRTP